MCKKEITEKSLNYVDPICLDCDAALSKSDRERTDFMRQYKLDHEACPNCGGLHHSTTLVGFIYNSKSPDDYKNLNDCKCVNCGNTHTTHERVPKSI
jgi:hypothetical protein